jgi:hypothetical protein
MKMYKHIAYNLTTGEVITCESSAYLKKMTRYITRVNRALDIKNNKWVFSHNGQINTKKW